VRLSGAFIAISAIALWGQGSAPSGLLRGVLIANAKVPGEFSIQVPNGLVYRFSFDARTWIERENERVSLLDIKNGEILEVVCDRDTAVVRYARMIHVVEKPVPRRAPVSLGLYRLQHSPVEFLAPRGDLTFSGIIANLKDDRLVLRTRVDGEKIIYLRKDTSYLERGFQVEPAVLRPNTRVFVRAGKNLDDEIEAYQVIWGEIFEPGAPRN
jgi:hypothetical protein